MAGEERDPRVLALLVAARKRVAANPGAFVGDLFLDALEDAVRALGGMEHWPLLRRACLVLARSPGPGFVKGRRPQDITPQDAVMERALRIEAHLDRIVWLDVAIAQFDSAGARPAEVSAQKGDDVP